MSESVRALLRGDPERVVFYDRGNAVRLRDLLSRAGQILDEIHRARLEPGRCVAVMLPNGFDAVAAFLAISAGGYPYFPLNTGLAPEEIRGLCGRCDIGAVVATAKTLDAGYGVAHGIAVDDLDARLQANLQCTDLDARRPFVYLATSGSTGEPKVVWRSAAAVDANCARVGTALKAGPDDRFLNAVPIWHANGFSNGLLMPLRAGAAVILMDRFLPRSMLETIDRHRPTVVIASPFVLRALARVLDSGSTVSSVRSWVSSGAALPASLDAELRGHGIVVRQLYGSSETGTISVSRGHEGAPGAVGRPLPGVKLRLRDRNGQAEAGSRGEVEVHSDALFGGYVGGPEAPSTEDGWYPMRDIGRFSGDGSLSLEGRLDRMINLAGVKVDPEEVRRVLESMPPVRRALVRGVPGLNGVDSIEAIVEADLGLETATVLDYCRGRLAEFKLPRTVRLVDDLPENLMGKYEKRLLED